ncbi:MAG: hypothetical protein MUF33_02015 [Candidatus Nanopelagicales bacterium]|nr:hypothetical protein [Candidatus Nanopelagicales bacterium]
MQRVATILWGGWLLVTWAVFSFGSGIIHEYYSIALAPAIAALVAMAVSLLWQSRNDVGLAILLGGSGVYGGTLLLRANYDVLGWTAIVVAAVAAVVFSLGDLMAARWRGLLLAALTVAALLGPVAFTAQTVSVTHSGSLPTAGPSLGGSSRPGAPNGGMANGGPGGLLDSPEVSNAVVALLNEDADAFTWVAAGIGSQTAAGFQLASGNPVMPIGGFNGSDPSPTLEQFQQWVAQGQIHWFIASSSGGMGPGGEGSSQITTWVQQTFESVTVDGVTLYDLTA